MFAIFHLCPRVPLFLSSLEKVLAWDLLFGVVPDSFSNFLNDT